MVSVYAQGKLPPHTQLSEAASQTFQVHLVRVHSHRWWHDHLDALGPDMNMDVLHPGVSYRHWSVDSILLHEAANCKHHLFRSLLELHKRTSHVECGGRKETRQAAKYSEHQKLTMCCI